MRSITRISLELELLPLLSKLKVKRVLDVGSKDSPYKNKISYKEYKRLDISKESNPDYVADLHNLNNLPRNYFDLVLATEVLEHLYNPEKAIDEIYKILRNGGICIATTRFFYHYHPDPKDYYRFTKDSLEYLFRKFKKVEIHSHGNWLQTLWQLFDVWKFGLIFKFFNPVIMRINYKNTRYPLGFIVYAEK
ncbi:MAG: class I SAM-dependent methyltransferase [Candidatus Omnitrophica bacterium]|nr:class I SAM-dependent methyltransferase [Candidatus Omnitrophota bacterium]